jgi:hypothetical protein
MLLWWSIDANLMNVGVAMNAESRGIPVITDQPDA